MMSRFVSRRGLVTLRAREEKATVPSTFWKRRETLRCVIAGCLNLRTFLAQWDNDSLCADAKKLRFASSKRKVFS
jgi:hypothetical protein